MSAPPSSPRHPNAVAAEVVGCAEIIDTLAAAGVSIRLEGARVVVEGARARDFSHAIDTLSGRERAVRAALGMAPAARERLARERRERAEHVELRRSARPPAPRTPKTTCKNGHQYGPDASLRLGRGRSCAICRREAGRRRRAAKRRARSEEPE